MRDSTLVSQITAIVPKRTTATPLKGLWHGVSSAVLVLSLGSCSDKAVGALAEVGDASIQPSNDSGKICRSVLFHQQISTPDIYVMLDQSRSMAKPLTGEPPLSRWEWVVDALSSFVKDPRAEGFGIGLQFFGQSVDEDCEPEKYAVPAVPIGRLPDVATAIEASLAGAAGPSTLTPTYPALQGALIHAQEFAKQNSARSTIVLLITDGLPFTVGASGNCNDSVFDVAELAAGPASSDKNVRTFVVVVADGLENLKFISQKGRGETLFLEPENFTQQFVEAMLDIPFQTACRVRIPEPQERGAPFDPLSVNLTVADERGAQSTIRKVNDASSCFGQGWRYDDKTDPKEILLGDQTCSAFPRGQLRINFGCPPS